MMKTYKFTAYDVCDEIALNIIAQHFNLNKKLKWEDTVLLKENNLNGIVSDTESKYIFLYHFGSIVFVNFEYHEVMDAIKYFKNISSKCFKDMNKNYYTEEFTLYVDENKELEISFDSMTIGTLNETYMATLSLVLSKSVSLDKIEQDIEILTDEVESVMDYLDRGAFTLKDKDLAKLSSKILRGKFDIVSYLRLLDKPDIAWRNEFAEELYLELIDLFDIAERFEKIKNKTEVLLNVIEVFSTIMHSKKGNTLEWIVIILIAFELILPVFEMFFK
ncbi:putative Rmd1/YagE family protein [Clostridium punense]|uniref:Rmd1/YagE family protein n=1 Tax=Clostridium punense TaxID=1054297 RepID=A0ABS4JYC6_9CLOT|nr:RMD1 family protein [Clostridium punense]MBP2020538.1 putative Rmd1/YagE family protein [Clostridium punense]